MGIAAPGVAVSIYRTFTWIDSEYRALPPAGDLLAGGHAVQTSVVIAAPGVTISIAIAATWALSVVGAVIGAGHSRGVVAFGTGVRELEAGVVITSP